MQSLNQAGPSQSPMDSRPITARCVKSRGFKNIDNHIALCPLCYFSMEDRYQYRYIYSHYLIITIDFTTLQCSICSHNLQTLESVYSCEKCTQRYFDYLRDVYLEPTEETRIRAPYIFHIDGDTSY